MPTILPTHTSSLRTLFDVEQQVPLLDDRLVPYVNFDNAASTPPLRAVRAAVNDFMPWYSSVHRGTGFKSQLATRAYEAAREITLRFAGANPESYVCIFGKNTTEALNKIARRLAFPPGRDVVLVSMIEHHANDLPYRAVSNVVHVGVTPTGELDEADFDRKLHEYSGRVALVAVSGASNVTGTLPPLRRLAAAIQQLEAIGMETVAAHEAELTAYALRQLRTMDGVILYGDTEPARARQRLGVIPFNLEGMSHFLVAAILGHEFGIGVRNGCFCAHPYILRLLQLSPAEVARLETRMRAGDRRQNPGLVRASFGLYNTLDEVDTFVTALARILRGEYTGRYHQDLASGDFVPENWIPDFTNYFGLRPGIVEGRFPQ